MDFMPTEAEQDVRGVAADALDRGDAGWQTLADAGLLGLALPHEHGGDGLGLAEVGVLLHELGRRALYLPVVETLCFAALPLVVAGTDAQKKRLLPKVAAGELRLTAALNEPGQTVPRAPSARLTVDGDGYRLRGRKVGVTAAAGAAAVLVPATIEDGNVTVAIVDPCAGGFRLVPSRSSRGEVEHTLHLDDVRVEADDLLVASAAGSPYDVVRRHAVAGLCLLGDGIVAGACALTADYVRERRQFGRALAEFQAVAQQVADVYIASRTIGLTARSAAWRVERRPRRRGRPRRRRALARRRGSGGAAHLPPPARRDGGRPDLPAAPLLLVGQGRGPRTRR